MPEESGATRLSVVLITLNEAKNLQRLLPTLPKGCDIVVLDSKSQDDTVAVAKKFGARVECREFDNFATQKNAALSMASRPWVLALDADELPDPEMWREILRIIAKDSATYWRMPRQLVFLGKPLRYGKTTDAPVRLFPRGKAMYQGDIHEAIAHQEKFPVLTIAKGKCAHFSYRDITDYFSRFNRYTTLIAENHARRGVSAPSHLGLMLRPLIEFISRYVFRLGFLDGYSGFVYALYSSVYAFTKYAKLKEIYEVGRQS